MTLPYKIRETYYALFHHTRKNSHLTFFLRGIALYYAPAWFMKRKLRKALRSFQTLPSTEREYIMDRVDYYCKFKDGITLPDDAPALSLFTYKARESYVHDYVNSTYFFDAVEYVRCFPQHFRWAYNPGDVNYLFPLPEITKSRPLCTEENLPSKDNMANRNNILLNLDKVRHFTWIYDPYRWEEKGCRILFRGDITNKPRRLKFIEMWQRHPWCDLQAGGHLSLYDHLKYRYIMALEGNDVASNLKWVMSSNSIAIMPRPTCETWYMEGRLIPDYHYIEIKEDYSDLIERITYYEEHPQDAKAIIQHAHEWVRQFWNKKREDMISLLVLDKYFKLTGQLK